MRRLGEFYFQGANLLLFFLAVQGSAHNTINTTDSSGSNSGPILKEPQLEALDGTLPTSGVLTSPSPGEYPDHIRDSEDPTHLYLIPEIERGLGTIYPDHEFTSVIHVEKGHHIKINITCGRMTRNYNFEDLEIDDKNGHTWHLSCPYPDPYDYYARGQALSDEWSGIESVFKTDTVEVKFKTAKVYTDRYLPDVGTVDEAYYVETNSTWNLEWSQVEEVEEAQLTSGVISSPGYPENYPSNIRTTNVIQVEEGHHIRITINKLDTVSSWLRAGYRVKKPDSIQITGKDGNQCEAEEDDPQIHLTPTWHLSGQGGAGIVIVCRADTAYLNFIIQSSYNSYLARTAVFSWHLEWSQIGAVETQGTRGVLTSPNWPRVYPNGYESTWVIQVEEGHRIKLDFTDFDTDPNDFIQITDANGEALGYESGPLANGTRSGLLSSFSIVYPLDTVHLKFTTDNDTRHSGWRLEWSQIEDAPGLDLRDWPDSNPEGLEEKQLPTSGEMTSPNFPSSEYPNDLHLTRIIKVAEGSIIRIHFTHFDVLDLDIGPLCSPNPYCTCKEARSFKDEWKCSDDFVEIQDGEGKPFAHLFGSNRTVDDLFSPTETVRVLFHTNGQHAGQGWRLEWGVAKPEDRPTSGVLTSPNYPENYTKHDLSTSVIQVAKGQHIKIRVTVLDVDYDILKIDDAKGGKCDIKEDYPQRRGRGSPLQLTTPRGKPPRGGWPWPPAGIEIVCRTDVVFVNFYAESSSPGGRGWHLEWAESEPDNTLVSNGTSGVLTSYRWPRSYPNEYEFTNIIQVGAGQHIKIDFTDFDLEPNGDFVTITDGNGEVLGPEQVWGPLGNGTKSGILPSFSIVCKVDTVQIKFTTDSSGTHSGWRVEWSQVEAESSYLDDGLSLPKQGYFTSPNYPNSYPNGLHLQKAIIVDEGYVVSISVKDFSMDHSSNHCTDYLEIKDGDGTLLGFLSNQAYSCCYDFVSHTETVFLLFHTDGQNTKQGWKLEWERALPLEDAQRPTEGQLTSPNFPSLIYKNYEGIPSKYKYPTYHESTRVIQVAEGHRIRIHFEYFATDKGNDYLEVTDGNGELLAERISGHGEYHSEARAWTSREVEDIESKTEKMFLRFRTLGGPSYFGWRLKWQQI